MRKISLVRASLVLLAALALSCVAGTLLPDDRAMRVVFGSWWFLALLGLNASSMAWVAYRRIAEAFRADNRPVFFREREDYENLRVSGSTAARRGEGDLDSVEKALRLRGYGQLFRQDKALSALAGRLQRWGSVVAHMGAILLLAGAAVDLLWGVRGCVVLSEGESTDRYLSGEADREGRPLGFVIRLADFEVVFHPNSSIPDRFASTVEIWNGAHFFRREIEVNRALRYGGFTLHQTSYGLLPDLPRYVLELRDRSSAGEEPIYLEANVGEPVEIPGSRGCNVVLEQDAMGIACAIRNPDGAVSTGSVFAAARMEKVDAYYSVLGVARHPGIWPVYLGCVLTIAGLAVSFGVRRRDFWAYWSEETARVYLGGRSRYARPHLEGDLAAAMRAIREHDAQDF